MSVAQALSAPAWLIKTFAKTPHDYPAGVGEQYFRRAGYGTAIEKPDNQPRKRTVAQLRWSVAVHTASGLEPGVCPLGTNIHAAAVVGAA
jgi:hypothetical protein